MKTKNNSNLICEKECAKCRKMKSLGEFHKQKDGKFGVRSRCKKCVVLTGKQQEKKRIYDKKYDENHKEKRQKSRKEYWRNNKNILTQKNRIWRDLNKEKIKQHKKKYRNENKEKIQEYFRINREKLSKKSLFRQHNNLNYRISHNLRIRLYDALFKKKKPCSTLKGLGCTIEELKHYLEKQFYNNPETGEPMTWNNYGKLGWHIDHVKPLNWFDLSKEKDFLIAVHYTNLQPMWAEENYAKHNKFAGRKECQIQ